MINKLVTSKKDIVKLKQDKCKLKQIINLNAFKIDSIEHHGPRENLRIYGIPESTHNKDDGEEIVHDIAKLLNIEIRDWEIQRVHRLGTKKSNKPRPIIVRFLSYKKRNDMLHSKSKLKNN